MGSSGGACECSACDERVEVGCPEGFKGLDCQPCQEDNYGELSQGLQPGDVLITSGNWRGKHNSLSSDACADRP